MKSTALGFSRILAKSFALVTTWLVATASAQVPPGSVRWVSSQHVNLRTSASLDAAIMMRLQRGAQVTLLNPAPASANTDANTNPLTFCEIETILVNATTASNAATKRGFIACQFLSEQLISATSMTSTTTFNMLANPSSQTRSPHVAPEIPVAELRYVVGSSVNLRNQADLKADVLTRMPINSKVRLIVNSSAEKLVSAQKFCEVEFFSDQLYRGYTACQYLNDKPILLEKINIATRVDGSANPQYNPEHAFWLQPSAANLFAYGAHLEATRMTEAERESELKNRMPNMNLRKRIPEFEAMKAKLAQAYIEPELLDAASSPAQTRDWNQLKVDVAKVWPEFEAQRSAFKQRMQGRDYNDSKWSTINEEDNSALKILKQISRKIEGSGNKLGYGAVPLHGLIHKVELPSVQSSFFKRSVDVVHHGVGIHPHSSPVQNLSHLWRIPMKMQFSRGAQYVEPGHYDGEYGTIAASWDIGTATASLTQAVWLNTISSKGKLEKSFQTPTAHLTAWRSSADDDCPDTFFYSEASSTFDGKYDYLGVKPYTQVNKEFKMAGFFTREEIKSDVVKVTQQLIRLNLAETGFFSARTFATDIDGDGVPDFALIEAVEPAADFIHFLGDRNAPFPTLRMYLFNVAGKWKIYGIDNYVFGCGC